MYSKQRNMLLVVMLYIEFAHRKRVNKEHSEHSLCCVVHNKFYNVGVVSKMVAIENTLSH